MSEIEILFWQTMGYLSLPGILVSGFIGVAIFATLVLSKTVDKD